MERWLGLRPGSVSPFGLINDPDNHVHLFLDANLRDCPAYSFHPNDNRATVVIPREEFLKYPRPSVIPTSSSNSIKPGLEYTRRFSVSVMQMSCIVKNPRMGSTYCTSHPGI